MTLVKPGFILDSFGIPCILVTCPFFLHLFRVHCPARCAHSDYLLYGTTEYRGVCECINLIQCCTQWKMKSFFTTCTPLTGLKHLRHCHPCRSGTEWNGQRLHFVENGRKGLLHWLHQEWHHFPTVSCWICVWNPFPALQRFWELVHCHFHPGTMGTTLCLAPLPMEVSWTPFNDPFVQNERADVSRMAPVLLQSWGI